MDIIIKNGVCQALKDLININKIIIKMMYWVKRE